MRFSRALGRYLELRLLLPPAGVDTLTGAEAPQRSSYDVAGEAHRPGFRERSGAATCSTLRAPRESWARSRATVDISVAALGASVTRCGAPSLSSCSACARPPSPQVRPLGALRRPTSESTSSRSVIRRSGQSGCHSRFATTGTRADRPRRVDRSRRQSASHEEVFDPLTLTRSQGDVQSPDVLTVLLERCRELRLPAPTLPGA